MATFEPILPADRDPMAHEEEKTRAQIIEASRSELTQAIEAVLASRPGRRFVLWLRSITYVEGQRIPEDPTAAVAFTVRRNLGVEIDQALARASAKALRALDEEWLVLAAERRQYHRTLERIAKEEETPWPRS